MAKVVSKEPKKKGSRIGRILRRLVFGILGILVLLIVFVAASIVIDGVIGDSADAYTNVTYTGADGTELIGYLAEPDGATTQPGIVMFHEWWGLNEDITNLADALASQGYTVLAPDAYRGSTTKWIPRAVWLVTQTDEAQIASDMDASFEYLASLDSVDAERMGTVGFCFGGRQSMNMAARQQERVTAVVSLYGTAYTDKSFLETLPTNVPILGIYGEDDGSIPADDVRAMDVLMDEVGLDHEVTIYDGVGHAFVNDENYDEAGAAGDAWEQLSQFFSEELGDSSFRPTILAKQPFDAVASDTQQMFCLMPH